jgi:formyltetrahydrofolate-dependent phosphoribosylglycinamide formyltransferase
MQLKLAVFVSGRGSNLKAILDSQDLKNLVNVKAVLSDKANCPAFEIARSHSVGTFCLGDGENCISYQNLAEKLASMNIDLIVLAGFLKLVPREVVSKFKNKIINIHPALLPSFGGKGMYGIHVHEAVFNSSAKVSGATIHFIDEEYDKGKIIAQRCVDISKVNSPKEIADKVLEIEHKLLPFVVKKFAENKIILRSNRVIIED